MDLDGEDFTEAIHNFDDLDDSPSSDGGNGNNIPIVPNKRTHKKPSSRNTRRKLGRSTCKDDDEYDGNMSDQDTGSSSDSSDGASDVGLDGASPKGKAKAKAKPRFRHMSPSPTRESWNEDDLRRAMEASLRHHRSGEIKPASPSGRPRLPSLHKDPLLASGSWKSSRRPPALGLDQVPVMSPHQVKQPDNTTRGLTNPKVQYRDRDEIPEELRPPKWKEVLSVCSALPIEYV